MPYIFIITALRTEPEDDQEGANASNLNKELIKGSVRTAHLEDHKGG